MVDRNSMALSLQLVGDQFSSFLLRKLSQEFRLHEISILHKFQMAIFRYCLTIESHGWASW